MIGYVILSSILEFIMGTHVTHITMDALTALALIDKALQKKLTK